jgi:hypothetical protein
MISVSVALSSQHRVKCNHRACQTNVQSWVAMARQHPPGSVLRNRYLNQIIREIAPCLWRTNTPDYADALQQTWFYFAKNICDTYDRDRACLVTWLNAYLWHRCRDAQQKRWTRNDRELPIDHTAMAGSQGWTIRDLPAPEYGSLTLLAQVAAWIEADADGRLRQTHLTDRPDVNAQILLQLRLPPETAWQEIAGQFLVPLTTVSSFYQRKCLPLLREFGRSEGLL